MRNKIVIVALLISSTNSWALNGAQVPGYSAATEAMGGAGASAGHLDSSTLITNPAGLSEISRGFRLGLLLGFPRALGTSAANPAAGQMTSNDDPVLLPSGSLVYPFLDGRLMWGMGVFSVAGFGNDYPASVASPVAAFATHSRFGLMKIVDGVSYRWNDRISIGVTFHFNVETLESNGSTATGTQTVGADRTDTSFGAGASAGILYKPFESLHVGGSYTSEQFFNNFERYTDILPRGLNYPQQANVGVAYWPWTKLLVATDFRWINWSGAGGGFGDSLAAGGLGWRDQFVLMGGVQYHLWEPLLVRAGYNYGRSAVPSNAMFINMLSSAIGKHHLGAGVGIRLIENIDCDISYMRAFSSTVTDNGALAPGSQTTLSGHQGSLDLTVRF